MFPTAERRMRVLNLGSLNIDRVFRVPHLVRGGETLASRSVQVFAGGKGANQSTALARAKAAVAHCGRVGPDGAWLIERLAAEGVDTRWIAVGDTPTGQAIIQVDDSGENAIVLLHGANHEIDQAQIDAALTAVGRDAIFLTQNETSGVGYCIDRAAELGLPVVFNPAPFTPDVTSYPLDRVGLLILNESEAAGLTGQTDPAAAVTDLRRRFSKTDVILTLGAAGVLYDGRDGRLHVPAHPTEVVDTTAAGDTFIGYFLAQRLRGTATDESLRIACRAAAICVSRPGAIDSIPHADD